MPALAVADRLTAAGAEVVFVGGQRAEAELVPAAGYELRQIRVEGLSRTNPLRAARALLRAGMAAGAAHRMLRQLRPDAVLGGGGYVAGPVGLAALARRIPLVLTEADSHLGITNRLLARARAPGLPGVSDRRPQRPALPRDGAARAAAGDGRGRGARPLPPRARRAVRARLRRLARRADDQRGRRRGVRRGAVSRHPRRRHARPCRARVARRRPSATTCARTSTTSPRRSPRATSASRAPGGSIFEIAAAGKPAILVPYPHASADHQTTNARWMEQAGAAIVVPDDELTGARLGAVVGALLVDRSRLDAMASAVRRAGPPGRRAAPSPTSCLRRPRARARGRDERLGWPAAALRRRRRRGDERAGADRRRARRRRHRL